MLVLAEALARRPPKELILARIVGGAADLQIATAVLHERRSGLLARGVAARAAAHVSATPAQDLVRIAVEQDVALVLVDGPAEVLRDPLVAGLLADAPSDVAVLIGGEQRNGPVLVPFVGAGHDWARSSWQPG